MPELIVMSILLFIHLPSVLFDRRLSLLLLVLDLGILRAASPGVGLFATFYRGLGGLATAT